MSRGKRSKSSAGCTRLSVAEMAVQEGISRQGMYQRLAREGRSLSFMVARKERLEVLRQAAARALPLAIRSSMPWAEIAAQIGYEGDITSLACAVRRLASRRGKTLHSVRRRTVSRAAPVRGPEG
ncbi:MAG: hypothetical protein OXD01_02605 [Gammaproteobacteria bacterium]|nr:hypothetical protein [Gammaproteobacteria bacterium]